MVVTIDAVQHLNTHAPGFGSNAEWDYAALAFRFLRQASRTNPTNPLANSGRAVGTGVKTRFTPLLIFETVLQTGPAGDACVSVNVISIVSE